MKKNALAVVFATVIAGAVPLLSASPAAATASQCQSYLAGKSYLVGPKVRAACAHGALGGSPFIIPSPSCLQGLGAIKVQSAHALEACKRA
ncbi:hypothetical protein [Streptomyces lavendulocolor]|uniref:hypothetical protein n=1 Tax=Streptomyces lavendulocolor TaxID=67316 RepID=UPI003C2C3237